MNKRNQPKPFRTALGLDPVVSFSLAGAIIFFVLSAAVAYYNVQTLRTNNESVVHTHEVITRLGTLLSSVQDAETGQRGFLLSNNDRYLDPYNAGLIAAPRVLNELTEMIRDNASQQRRMAVLLSQVDAKFAELRETIELRRSQGVDAALAVVNSDRGKIAMDGIRSQIGEIRQEENRLRGERLATMASAYNTAFASSVLSGLLGILLTVAISVLLRRSTIARRREEWLQSGHVGLNAALMGDNRVEELGDRILEYLTGYSGAVAGAIFVCNEEQFQRASSYGVPSDANLISKFKGKEGLLGRAVVERRAVLVSDVPDNYLSFGSGLGQDKPRHLVILPGMVDENVNSVIELGFLQPVTSEVLEIGRAHV